MTTALAVVRTVHLAPLIGLVRSLAVSLLVLRAPPATAGVGRDVLRRCDAKLVRMAWWWVLGGLRSALALGDGLLATPGVARAHHGMEAFDPEYRILTTAWLWTTVAPLVIIVLGFGLFVVGVWFWSRRVKAPPEH